MLATGWKKMLTKSGRSQRSMADRLGVNVTEMNMVCQGRAFLDPCKFDRACELLECRPTDLYAEDALAFLYGRAHEQVRKRGLRVELEPKPQEFVELLAEKQNMAKSRIVNEIIYDRMREVYENDRD